MKIFTDTMQRPGEVGNKVTDLLGAQMKQRCRFGRVPSQKEGSGFSFGLLFPYSLKNAQKGESAKKVRLACILFLLLTTCSIGHLVFDLAFLFFCGCLSTVRSPHMCYSGVRLWVYVKRLFLYLRMV